MEDNASVVDDSPQKPPQRQRRLAIALALLAFGVAAVVAAGPFLVVPAYMVLHDNFLGRSHPQYSGVSMRLAEGKVVRILAEGGAGETVDFYVDVDGNGKSLEELTAEDLRQLGFRESDDRRYGVRFIFGPEGHPKFQSSADLVNNTADSLYIKHAGIRFSAHRDGPFLELPVPFERVEEVFGKPVKWNREKARWF